MSILRKFSRSLILPAAFIAATAGFTHKTNAQAIDLAELGIQAVAGGGGYLIGKALHNNTVSAIGAGLGPVIAELGYDAFKNSQNRKMLNSFVAGQDYQRWIMSTKHWYDLTLDPNTGLREAFTGLDFRTGRPKTLAPGNQNPGSEYQKKADGSDQLQEETPFSPVTVTEGNFNGINRTQRVVFFIVLN